VTTLVPCLAAVYPPPPSYAVRPAVEPTFTITPSALAFYTARGQWEAEPGAFTVFVGGNSRDVKEASFTLR